MRTHAWGSLGCFLALLSAGGLLSAAQAPSPPPGPAKEPIAELTERLAQYDPLDPRRTGASEREDSPASSEAHQLLARLKQLSEPELEKLLKDIHSRQCRAASHDLCLTEVVNRGGRHWETVLTDLLKARAERRKEVEAEVKQFQGVDSKDKTPEMREAEGTLYQERWRLESDLEILTALRRVQKKDDPLIILVPGLAERYCKLGYPLVFEALLVNIDPQHQPVNIAWGGGCRSGRLERWRFEVKDADGAVLPPKELHAMMGGGIFTRRAVAFGESFAAYLFMPDYVDIEKPGNYTVRILYHDHVAIADIDVPGDLDGLILCRSLPIRLKVEPIVVKLSEDNRRHVAEWIARLPDKGPLFIHGGSYVEESHAYIPPESPAGKILAMGWPAVPQLIQAASSGKITPMRRAWALGLLYGITGRNDPTREAGVLGAYEYRHSGWATLGGPGNGHESMGFGRMSMSATGGQIDEKKQVEFAKRWLPWIEKDYIKVETVNKEPDK